LYLAPTPSEVTLLEFSRYLWQQKTTVPGAWPIVRVWRCLRDSTINHFDRTWACDRQTDGHTTTTYAHQHSIARQKRRLTYIYRHFKFNEKHFRKQKQQRKL